MGEQSFFMDALSDFTSEVAYGDAVKRLTDEGFTCNQIMKKIDYPAPKNRVCKMITQRLIETGVIKLEEPLTEGMLSKKYVAKNIASLEKYILKKLIDNGEANSYVRLEIDFNKKELVSKLSDLDTRQIEYLQGVFQDNKVVYHILNLRMREILHCLYNKEGLDIICYFVKDKEKIMLA